MQPWIMAVLALIGGYLAGSIPFGLLLTRLGGTEDLRGIGSGNIGATNVLRTGRKGLAAATLILDGAKGAVALLIAGAVAPQLAPFAGIGAFYGHIFPVWLGFRGGKGVATYLGIALAFCWPAGLVFAVVWLGLTFLSRISSVGGIGAAVLTPIAAFLLGRSDAGMLFLAFALTILWTHRANLARLFAGTEPRIGAKTA
jgi:acyl phosphate:glycerol-3-phosphate acyltransferase